MSHNSVLSSVFALVRRGEGARAVLRLVLVTTCLASLLGIAVPVSAAAPRASAAADSSRSLDPRPVSRISAFQNGPQFTVTGARVNVRSGPGTNYAILGMMTRGQTGYVSGKNAAGTWYRFTFGAREGWISAGLVRVNGSLAPVSVVQAPAAEPSTPAQGGSASGFAYGIQVKPGDLGFIVGKVQGLGFNWVKVQIPWEEYERSPGSVEWGSIDDMANAFSGAGLNTLVSVTKAPDWARPANADLSVEGPPADFNTFGTFLGQLAGRYCGKINAIEVWNEQNLHYEWGNEPIDPSRYVDMLRVAYHAIKAACPQTIVVSGALTPTGAGAPWAMDDFAYLEGMYRAGLRNVADAIGAHPSGYNVAPDVTWQAACNFITQQGSQFRGACDTPHHSWSFRSTMEGYRNIMVRYGDGSKRIWATEWGWAAAPALDGRYLYADDNTQEEQAQWTVQAFQMMRNWGWVGPAFLWNLNFSMTNPGSELAQWSIVDSAGGDGPTYRALQEMAK